jgi:hypothetical protein
VNFSSMSNQELMDWVEANNNDLFDLGELPSFDDCRNDDEMLDCREQWEQAADEILSRDLDQAERIHWRAWGGFNESHGN